MCASLLAQITVVCVHTQQSGHACGCGCCGCVVYDPLEMMTTGEVHMVLDHIVGTADGIGVENLQGSGLIAGVTSWAYKNTFTLSYVSGRSVGIGSYINRLR